MKEVENFCWRWPDFILGRQIRNCIQNSRFLFLHSLRFILMGAGRELFNQVKKRPKYEKRLFCYEQHVSQRGQKAKTLPFSSFPTRPTLRPLLHHHLPPPLVPLYPS